MLLKHHSFRLEELDNMLPWEREIYITLLMQHIKEENERIKNQNG